MIFQEKPLLIKLSNMPQAFEKCLVRMYVLFRLMSMSALPFEEQKADISATYNFGIYSSTIRSFPLTIIQLPKVQKGADHEH